MRTWMILVPLLAWGCSGGNDDKTTTDDTGATGDDDDVTGDDDDDASRIEDILALTGNSANGNVVYSANCEFCHAVDGSGGTGSDLRQPTLEIPVIVESVYGGVGVVMSPYKDFLSNQEIADVAAYVKETFAQ